jgi:hypothetical protein
MMMLAVLLAQASASPTATACPPTQVKRVKRTDRPDAERLQDDHWCTGISCFVVEILVTVNADGTIRSAVVQKANDYGSGQVALREARDSTYIPAMLNCKGIAGTYLFRELFFIHRD